MCLCASGLAGIDSVHLRGNHDHEFLAFLKDSGKSSAWLHYGGDATIYSYGVRIPAETPAEDRLAVLGERLRAAVPAGPRRVPCRPAIHVRIGDYLFVHAGVDPDKPIDQQTPHDMLWIRDAFLEADADFGKVVVHGHSVTELPEVREQSHRHRYRRLLHQRADVSRSAGQQVRLPLHP